MESIGIHHGRIHVDNREGLKIGLEGGGGGGRGGDKKDKLKGMSRIQYLYSNSI